MTVDTTNPTDPLDNFNYYVRQWDEANKQWDADYLALTAAITNMLKLAKEGKIDEAFQAAERTVMPGAMGLQGDSMGQLAASMNVSSAAQEFITDAQNDMNSGKDITAPQAAAFVKTLQEMYNAVKEEMNLPKNERYIHLATAQNILNALDKASSPFGAKTPNGLDPAKVEKDIKYWIAHPQEIGSNGNTGQQNLQNLQSGLTQGNNTVSAQSQGLQAQEQFASNTYNQFMNTCLNIFQAEQKQIQSMVQNQKSS